MADQALDPLVIGMFLHKLNVLLARIPIIGVGLGIRHAVPVGRADDVEPYLWIGPWIGSLFLIAPGVLTAMVLYEIA